MVLIDCPECGREVSDRAPACPRCAAPIAGSVPDPPDRRSGVAAVAGDGGREEVPPPGSAGSDHQHVPDVEGEGDSGERAAFPPVDGHIFVSYKSEDRQRARLVAQALERRGWPVWWDRDIQAGQAFRRVIAKALSDATCMVVLWTERSIDSEWVQEEAQEAKARHILVPVLLDEVRPPLGFGQMQAAKLVAWAGEPDDPMLDDLLRAIAAQLGLTEVPPLLGDEDWATVVASERAMRGRAAAARATEERAAAAVAREDADRAASERATAAHAGQTDVAEAAARREAAANAMAAEATEAAERREAEMAAELAAEHAAELRAVAARRAAKEAEARAAEEAAQRAEREREAARTTAEREAAARAAERAASLRAAEVAAQAAEETADQFASTRDDDRWAASGLGAKVPAAKASWFRFPNEGVATLLGAVLVGISAYLPWTAEPKLAVEYPLEILQDPDAWEGSSLGVLLVSLAVVGGILALFRVPRWITVLIGGVVVTVSFLFVVTVVRSMGDDGSVDLFFETIGIGPGAAIAGSLLMLSGR